MSSTHQIERNRGAKDSRQQLAVLREKWPLAFPAKHEDVRPLAVGAAREIAAEMSWSLWYTHGVLAGWKMAPAYCEAVLRYDQRIALGGSPAKTIAGPPHRDRESLEPQVKHCETLTSDAVIQVSCPLRFLIRVR